MEIDLAVFPGDGIGPEIVEEALRVLDAVSRSTQTGFRYHFCEIGDGVREKTGEAIPKEAIDLFGQHKLALKGPVGESVGDFVSQLRMKFDLYANQRPVKSYPRISPPALRGDIDLVVVRENIEDIYIAKESEVSPGVWRLEGIFTKEECQRIAKYSFGLARNRKRKLAVVHKSNILKRTHGLFVNTFREELSNFPDVEFESYYADALAAHLVRRPQDFDVIACPNLIGDILSDLAAEVGGGLGLAGSANVNPESGMGLFEPVHGSAPDISGKKIADPISEIRCVGLLLNFLAASKEERFSNAAQLVEEGIAGYLQDSPVEMLPVHLGGRSSTPEITDGIISKIRSLAEKSPKIK